MGLFKKKYDYENDRLQYKYDLETDQYYCSAIGGSKIDSKMLNFKTRRLLKKKNRMTEQDRESARALARHEKLQLEDFKRRSQAIDQRRANGWPALGYDSFEVLGTPQIGDRFSPEVRGYLEDLTAEEKNADYIVGIHRIGDSEEHLESLLSQGIKVQGHMMGAAKGKPELGNTVGYYPNNTTIMKEVAHAHEYKSSRGSIVVKIPKEDIIAGSIYVTDEQGKDMYLNPEYIVGYFPIEDDRTVSQMVTKDTLAGYREQRAKEAQEYISLGDKTVSHPPPSVE